MKTAMALLLCLLVLLFLSSCAQEEYTVVRREGTFLVDPARGEITCDGVVYEYSITGNRTFITYPNGSVYYKSASYSGAADTTADFDGYIAGDVLMDVLPEQKPGREPGAIAAAVVLVIVGVWGIVSPYSLWYLRYGWWYKNAEPSDGAILLSRVGGYLSLAIGVLVFIAA